MRNIKRLFFIIILFFGTIFFNNISFATDYSTVYLTSTYKYSFVEKLVNLINEGRNKENLESVVLNDELTNLAMQRATENILLFSHDRPNGTTYSTISNKIYLENIATGEATPELVYNDWYNSYGHKQVLMSDKAKTVGIGAVIHDGTIFWTYEVSYDTANDGYTLGNKDKKQTKTVSALPSYYKTSIYNNNGVLDYEDYTNYDSSNIYTGNVNFETSRYYSHNYNIYIGDNQKIWVRANNPETLKLGGVPVALIDNNTYNWTSSNEQIATVSSNGIVTAKTIGTVKIIATNKTNINDKVEYTLKCYYPFTDEYITVSDIEDQEYTGKIITPKVIIKYNNKILTENIDYTLEFDNNTKIGKANIFIKGIGNYFGEKLVHFYIKEKSNTNTTINNNVTNTSNQNQSSNTNSQNNSNTSEIKEDNERILLNKTNIKFSSIGNQLYTGNKIEPNFSVTYYKVRKLKKNKDYTVKYSNNTKIGTAKITITGINEFYGTVSITFKIIPNKVTKLKVKSSNDNSIKLTWNNIKGVTGYRVYIYNAKTKKYEYYKKTKTNSIEIEKLKAGTRYKIKVRAYKTVNDIQYFGNYSSILQTVTKPKKIVDLKVKSKTKNSVKISWKKSVGATGHKVYIYNIKTKKYEYYKKTLNTSLTISKLKSNNKYKIKIKAYKSFNRKQYLSNYSSVLKIYTK